MHSSRHSNSSTSQVQGTEGSTSTGPAGRDYYSDEQGGVAPGIVGPPGRKSRAGDPPRH